MKKPWTFRKIFSRSNPRVLFLAVRPASKPRFFKKEKKTRLFVAAKRKKTWRFLRTQFPSSSPLLLGFVFFFFFFVTQSFFLHTAAFTTLCSVRYYPFVSSLISSIVFKSEFKSMQLEMNFFTVLKKSLHIIGLKFISFTRQKSVIPQKENQR